MSIATTMRQQTAILRDMISRHNGDITNGGPAVLDALDAEIGRVQALEEIAPINMDLLKNYQAQGGIHVETGN